MAQWVFKLKCHFWPWAVVVFSRSVVTAWIRRAFAKCFNHNFVVFTNNTFVLHNVFPQSESSVCDERL